MSEAMDMLKAADTAGVSLTLLKSVYRRLYVEYTKVRLSRGSLTMDESSTQRECDLFMIETKLKDQMLDILQRCHALQK